MRLGERPDDADEPRGTPSHKCRLQQPKQKRGCDQYTRQSAWCDGSDRRLGDIASIERVNRLYNVLSGRIEH
jgi:hypothetical protein